jgi:predicted DNA-binding protein (UPF0251 family)
MEGSYENRHDWYYSVDGVVGMFVDAGLLTEQQASAFLLSEFENTSRQPAAENMEISVEEFDERVSTARETIEKAEKTLSALSELKNQTPDECIECGVELDGLL